VWQPAATLIFEDEVVQAAAQSKKARRKQRKRLASADAERCGVFNCGKGGFFRAQSLSQVRDMGKEPCDPKGLQLKSLFSLT